MDLGIVDRKDWSKAAEERKRLREERLRQKTPSPANVLPTTPTSSTQLKEGAYFIGHADIIYRHFAEGDRLVIAPKSTSVDPENKKADNGSKKKKYLRLELLTKLRETRRNILALQKEYSDEMIKGLDEAPWAPEQRRLIELYDAFTKNFGALNKYKWQTTGQIDEDGNRVAFKIRTNFKEFKKDPDCYAVASIEEFDEDTQEAKLGSIAHERVVRARSGKPILKSTEVEKALAYCLDEKSEIDLDFMAELLPGKNSGQIQNSLIKKGLAFIDPKKEQLVTKNEYLSGDIRQKNNDVADAIADGSPLNLEANTNALSSAMPDTIPMEDINISLGMPWIPKEIIAEFAQSELGLSKIEVDYTGSTHSWFVSAHIKDYGAAKYEFGTDYTDSRNLLERALNGRAPVIRSSADSMGGESAKALELKLSADRMDHMKDRFKKWINEDEERARCLEEIYNRRFNAIVPRKHNGDHISFAGSNIAIELQKHQRNGVARGLHSPTTLLEWDVGAGKTYAAIADCMEGQRHNRFKKPMMVVQNHLLGEFSRDFYKLYPDANILVVENDQFIDHGESATSEEKVLKFVEKASQNDYDAIIITKSNFDRFDISPQRKAKKLFDQIKSLENEAKNVDTWRVKDHLRNEADKVKKKAIQYLGIDQDCAFEEDLESNLVMHKAIIKLDELVELSFDDDKWQPYFKRISANNPAYFEDLGVDKVYVDEAHDYKNLTIKSRVADVNKSGSKRAESFKEKLDYLREANPQNYATLLTATPVLNALMEFFVFQQYLQPELLEENGISHPDAWISMFGETSEDIELAPETGYYRAVKRLSSYKNIPELMRFYQCASDVMTREELQQDLPDLVDENGKYLGSPQVVEVAESKQLNAYFKTLIERATMVRGGEVHPSDDNILKIINEARLATLDPRLVGLERDENIPTKIDVSAQEIAKRYHANKDKVYFTDEKQTDEDPLPGSLQMVLCNQGIPKGDGSFSIYEQLQDKLIADGVPAEKIAFIHDHDSDKKKEELFRKCRTGEISVLVGTTQKLGTGTNVQKRLIALHELDAPWRPGDIIQGRGRIERPKNQNPAVEILTYIQEGSFDIYNWQMLLRKAGFIAQAKMGASTRTFEEDDPFSMFCEMALNWAANNPLLAEKGEITQELKHLRFSRDAHKNEQKRSRQAFKQNDKEMKTLMKEYKTLKALQSAAIKEPEAEKPFNIDGQMFRRTIRSGKALKKAFRRMRQELRDGLNDNGQNEMHTSIGSVYGVEITAKAAVAVSEKDGGAKDYKYTFSIVLDDDAKTEINIPVSDIQETKLEKDFEKAANHDDLKTLFGNTMAVREKRRELSMSFARVMGRVIKPFQDIQKDIDALDEKLTALHEDRTLYETIISNDFKLDDRYQTLMRRMRTIDKKLLKAANDDDELYDYDQDFAIA